LGKDFAKISADSFKNSAGFRIWILRAGGVWGGMRAELFWVGAKNSETTKAKLSRALYHFYLTAVM